MLGTEEVREADHFTYLGSMLTINGDCLTDTRIKNRLCKTAAAVNKLNKCWRKKIKQKITH